MAQDKPQKPAPASDGPDRSLEKKLADLQESVLAGQPVKTQPMPEPMPAEGSTEKPSTVLAVVAEVPLYPRGLIVEAEIENEHREFNRRLVETRMAPVRPPYTPPPVPPALAEQTRLEMAEGARLVAKAEKIKSEQKAMARVPDKWESKTVEVFRPPDFDEYRKSFATPGQTVSKDQLKR